MPNRATTFVAPVTYLYKGQEGTRDDGLEQHGSMARSDDPATPYRHRDWLRLVTDGASLNLPQQRGRADITEKGVSAPESIISLVAGSFADPVSQIWAGERIKDYLTAPDARRHLWHAWLSSERMTFTPRNRMSADLAYARLTFLKGRDLVLEAYGHQPPGLAKALSGLGAEARTPEFYRALMRALSTNGAGAKFLRHTHELSDEIVFGLAALPAGLATKGIVELLKRSRVAPKALGFFTWTLSRLETILGPGVSHSVLQAPNPLEALWEVVLNLPFPKAPWPGTDQLVPVTSRAELQEVAQKFENCLSDPDRQRQAVVTVLNGAKYFYIWMGKEPALLEFGRIGEIGWCVQQARGIKNRKISQATRDAISDVLTAVPIFCPIWEPGPRYYSEDELLRELEF